MSRLSKILGVKEGQEFRYAEIDSVYKVEKEFLYYRGDEKWTTLTGTGIYSMIENPDKIYPICKLTDQQITAIKGRIAEGTPWFARDKYGALHGFRNKPNLSVGKTYFYSEEKYAFPIESDLYDFITFDNSPVYLPELVEGSEEE